MNPYNMYKVYYKKIVVAYKGKLKLDFVNILSPLYKLL